MLMNIKIQNVGLIKKSEFKFDGLTVITGLNNSGKSTVGKTVYSLFSSVENLRNNALIDTRLFLLTTLTDLFDSPFFYAKRRILHREKNLVDDVAQDFLKYYQNSLDNIKKAQDLDSLLKIVNNLSNYVKNNDLSFLYGSDSISFGISNKKIENVETATKYKEIFVKQLEKTIGIINSDRDLVEYANTRILKQLNAELNNQILPIDGKASSAKIEVFDGEIKYFEVNLKNEKIIDQSFFFSPFKNTYFIDDIYALDRVQDSREISVGSELNFYRYQHFEKTRNIADITAIKKHNEKLIDHILKNNTNIYAEIENDRVTDSIMEEINKILPKKISFYQGKLVYSEDKLDIRNLATGSKMFALFKILLEKGLISKSTLLILDEPESHLHPKWQNILAEIIVLLVKKTGVNTLLTTHSPNFLLALDVFSKKYEIKGKTNFYQSKQQDLDFTFLNINNSINEAYSLMSIPFLELEKMIY